MNKLMVFFGLFLCFTLGVLWAASGSAVAQTLEEPVVAVLSKAKVQHHDGNFEQSVALAKGLLARSNLTPEEKIAIYETLSITYDCWGDQYKQVSLEYLNKIAELGPCLVNLPRDNWPKHICTTWYNVAYKKEGAKALNCAASSNDTGATKIQTIAFPLPFDNNSIGEYQQTLGGLGTTLAQMFQGDFSKISSLKIVERDKIDYIINEHKLAESGVVDQATAVKAGRLLSAHLMVFGGFTQIDKNNTILVIRVVNVETSEVIATLPQKGGSNYFEMEKELVKKICDELDIILSEPEVKEVEMGGTNSLDATVYYANGLGFEEKYEYKEAFENFKKAYEIDPKFIEAKQKMEVYWPFII